MCTKRAQTEECAAQVDSRLLLPIHHSERHHAQETSGHGGDRSFATALFGERLEEASPMGIPMPMLPGQRDLR